MIDLDLVNLMTTFLN